MSVISDAAVLQTALKESAAGSVVNFVADWCEPSKLLQDHLKTALEQYDGVKLLQVDATAEACTDLFKVESIPAVLMFPAGSTEPAERVIGAHVDQIGKALAKSFRASTSSSSLDARIRALVSSRPVMLLMKGTAEAPFCKFSRATMEMLSQIGFKSPQDFGTFNILEDEAVRQRVKELFAFPTFPQLYVDGDLVGGLDVMRELNEADELVPILKEAGKGK